MKKIFTTIMCALLAACSSSPPKTNVESIQVVAESNANQNTATALDIVFVYDTTAAGMLPKTGPDWFDKKASLVSGLAKSIDVVSLQVPPAMTVEVPLPKKYYKAIGVYSYANYLEAAGQPMGNLTPYKKMTIRLTPDNIVYSGN
jgi:type VI secretion system protein